MSAMRKYLDRRSNATFVLQITSMVDMFTILLVFLLKSFSTSAVTINPTAGLTLPKSSSQGEAIEALKMVVSKDGIFVEDKQVVVFTDGVMSSQDISSKDESFIEPLFSELGIHADKSKKIAEVNETMEFDGKVILQADQSLPYSLLKKVMYTSMMAGYADVKLAVMAVE